MRRKRPRSVTFLALGVLTLAALFWSRVIQSIRLWDYLSDLPAAVHPAYLLVTGLVFGAAALPLVWGLWLGRHWASRSVHIFMGTLVLYYWLDRLLLGVSETARSNWPFALGLTIVLISWIGWLFTRPAIRKFFEG
jgi:hypothetical protein